MAYDPTLTSFIIVGVVGGLAAFLNVSSEWELTRELARATDSWTSPLVVRRYRNDSATRQTRSREAAVLQGHGYRSLPRPDVEGGPTPGGAVASGEHSETPETRPAEVIFVTYHLA